MQKLEISNGRVVEFYKQHPALDFENINIMVVDMLENIINTKSLDNMLAKQIVDNLDLLKNSLSTTKDEYMEELNKIIHNSTISGNENLTKMIKEHSNTIQDRTKLILTEYIPKNNDIISNIVSLTELRLKEHLSEIKNITNSNKDKQNKLEDDVNSLIHKMDGAVGKGKVSETSLELVLNNLFPSAEIVNSSKTKESADYILRRDGLHDIRFENKNYTANVPITFVNKFKRDMEVNNSSGIMLCQNFGIVSKNNYEFEIFNGNVYVYLHKVNYDPDKIKTAVDIIDHIKKEIQNKEVNKDIFMDKELFAKINAEFIKIIEKRDNIIINIKKYNEHIIKDLRDVDFPILRDFININSGSTETKKFKCEFCGLIPPKNNLKALQTHYRFCKDSNVNTKKINIKSPSESSSEINSDNELDIF
jgi:hypothetical protein